MSTPLLTCRSACCALPASAATFTPCSCARSTMSFGGDPSALAISDIGWPNATSTSSRATSSVQPTTPPTWVPSGSAGRSNRSMSSATKSQCSWSIIDRIWPTRSARSLPCTSSDFCGITTSTPYGLPSACSSIQVSSISSCSGLSPTAPSTPSPPARLTATATSRQWVKAKIGYSIPTVSHRDVCTASAPATARLCGHAHEEFRSHRTACDDRFRHPPKRERPLPPLRPDATERGTARAMRDEAHPACEGCAQPAVTEGARRGRRDVERPPTHPPACR